MKTRFFSPFVFISVLFIILITGFTIYSIEQLQHERAAILQRAKSIALFSAQLMSERAANMFSEGDFLLQEFQHELAYHDIYERIHDGEEAVLFLQDLNRKVLLSQKVRGIELFDSTGRSWWRNGNYHMSDRQQALYDEAVKMIFTDHKENISGYSFRVIHQKDDSLFFHVRCNYDQDNRLAYLMTAIIDEEYFFGHKGFLAEEELANLILADQDMTPVIHWSSGDDEIQEDFLNNHQNAVMGGTATFTNHKSASASFQVTGYPLFVITDIRPSSALALWDKEYTRSVMLFVMLFLIVTVIWILIIYSYRKMRKMETRSIADLRIKVKERTADLKMANERLSRHLKEREILLAEIHHRVKNNLGVIRSIIGLSRLHSTQSDDLDPLWEDINHRIRSIEIVHDKLYKNGNYASIQLEDYIRELVDGVLRALKTSDYRILINIEEIRLETNKIIPIGLICTELVTNAVKYGLEKDGQLDIMGRRVEQDFELTVRNNGRPFTSKSGGLGMLLIKSLVEQLNGRMERLAGPDTVFQLRFPV